MDDKENSVAQKTKQILLFNLSGVIGTAVFYQVYTIFLRWEGMSPSLSWSLSYFLSIIWQHALHRYLVFGTSSPYLPSLFKTYLAYLASIVLSSIFMPFLTFLNLNATIAWLVNLVFTGVVNFFTVSSAFE